MKKLLSTIALLCLGFSIVSTAHARDTRVEMPIQDALQTPDAQEKLTGNIQFFFGNQAHPAIGKKHGKIIGNRRTNGVGKSDEESCQRAFLSAMLVLQERAETIGANAVVNIESYFKRKVFSSPDTYECYIGSIMTGVTLRGDMVTLSK